MAKTFNSLVLLLMLKAVLSISGNVPDFRANLDSFQDFQPDVTQQLLKSMAAAIVNLEEKIKQLEPLEEKVRNLETKLKIKDAEVTKLDALLKQILGTKLDNDYNALSRSIASYETAANINAKDKVRKLKPQDENLRVFDPKLNLHDIRMTKSGTPSLKGSSGELRPGLTGQKTESIVDKVESRGIRQAGSVSFSAVLTHPLTHLDDNHVIKFDRILINEGGGYQVHTGAFTAPRSGVYLFMYNIGHHGTSEVWVELVKNGAGQNGAAVEGHFFDQNLQGGNAAVLRLEQGDLVWIQTFQVFNCSMQSFFSTFSGVLLGT